MIHELPKLSYAPDALEPIISAKTIEFHYGKHHQAYVNNLNKLLQESPFDDASLEKIIKKAEGGIFDNGAQVWNHTFNWKSLEPGSSIKPMGTLKQAIDSEFGSFSRFKEEFSQAAATLFGSGWAWLVKTGGGKLEIVKESNAGNPLRSGKTPLLICDVWEHAYYLDYQNRRVDYIESSWKLVNWEIVGSRF